MTTLNIKQKAIQAIERLPETASYEDMIEQIILLEKIERGLNAKSAGKLISQDEAVARLNHDHRKMD